MTEKLMLLI